MKLMGLSSHRPVGGQENVSAFAAKEKNEIVPKAAGVCVRPFSLFFTKFLIFKENVDTGGCPEAAEAAVSLCSRRGAELATPHPGSCQMVSPGPHLSDLK